MKRNEPASSDEDLLLRQLTVQLRERITEAHKVTREALEELDATLIESRVRRALRRILNRDDGLA